MLNKWNIRTNRPPKYSILQMLENKPGNQIVIENPYTGER